MTTSFKRLLADVKKRKQYLDIGQQIAEARKARRSAASSAPGSRRRRSRKLEEERRKFVRRWRRNAGSTAIRASVLLSTVRDYALDGALNQDAAWREIEPSKLPFPIAAMFESARHRFRQDADRRTGKAAQADRPRVPAAEIRGPSLHRLRRRDGHGDLLHARAETAERQGSAVALAAVEDRRRGGIIVCASDPGRPGAPLQLHAPLRAVPVRTGRHPFAACRSQPILPRSPFRRDARLMHAPRFHPQSLQQRLSAADDPCPRHPAASR